MRYSILALTASIPAFALIATGASGPERGVANRVTELEAQVEVLAAALQDAQEILQFVHIETGEMEGLTGPHWIIEGANVHVRSGSGETKDDCWQSDPNFPNCENLTGLGNLILGYNERFFIGGVPTEVRTGSHNLVVGDLHSYSSVGGLVAGEGNAVTGWHASVIGGTNNDASGIFASVSGGHQNEASGLTGSVSGGQFRVAPDEFNWAAGDLFEPN
jgi:hypothetical protein